jgi:aspartate racemase
MKSIGIVGGMSPESTLIYYRSIVSKHLERFGDHSYPRLIIASVSFQKFIDWQHDGKWSEITEALEQEFQSVARAGADFTILATNTMHKVIEQIKSPVPVFNIMDAVKISLEAEGIQNVVLMGTRFTMSDGFYVDGLSARGFKVKVPSKVQQDEVHRIIYEELIRGVATEVSGRKLDSMAGDLLVQLEGEKGGKCALLLACTELVLLTPFLSKSITWRDTTEIHATLSWEIATGQRPEPISITPSV